MTLVYKLMQHISGPEKRQESRIKTMNDKCISLSILFDVLGLPHLVLSISFQLKSKAFCKLSAVVENYQLPTKVLYTAMPQ